MALPDDRVLARHAADTIARHSRRGWRVGKPTKETKHRRGDRAVHGGRPGREQAGGTTHLRLALMAARPCIACGALTRAPRKLTVAAAGPGGGENRLRGRRWMRRRAGGGGATGGRLHRQKRGARIAEEIHHIDGDPAVTRPRICSPSISNATLSSRPEKARGQGPTRTRLAGRGVAPESNRSAYPQRLQKTRTMNSTFDSGPAPRRDRRCAETPAGDRQPGSRSPRSRAPRLARAGRFAP